MLILHYLLSFLSSPLPCFSHFSILGKMQDSTLPLNENRDDDDDDDTTNNSNNKVILCVSVI